MSNEILVLKASLYGLRCAAVAFGVAVMVIESLGCTRQFDKSTTSACMSMPDNVTMSADSDVEVSHPASHSCCGASDGKRFITATSQMSCHLTPLDETLSPLAGMSFIDQHGREYRGEELIGKPVVASFIYTRCENQMRCPMITQRFAQLYDELANVGLAGRVNVVLMTFDPLFDSPGRLLAYGAKFGIPADSGLLLLTSRDNRSAAFFRTIDLSVNYERSGRPNAHGTLLLLFDKQGRMAKRYEVVIPDDAVIISELIQLLE